MSSTFNPKQLVIDAFRSAATGDDTPQMKIGNAPTQPMDRAS